ncbi:hypothetical protein K443DRAFT_333197 [Laccaria amethystina LaAM-08-1]|uniref:Uncharacterized protein n=1 Tax=Laccaria amethystina LaAM-08-1 TaxID=1095629 RepID=A0A0C9WJS4_9AGAR|nr:hypothetical protein K443DRAFT_333197 [Laccaria amethystina LaAM-08-1]
METTIVRVDWEGQIHTFGRVTLLSRHCKLPTFARAVSFTIFFGFNDFFCDLVATPTRSFIQNIEITLESTSARGPHTSVHPHEDLQSPTHDYCHFTGCPILISRHSVHACQTLRMPELRVIFRISTPGTNLAGSVYPALVRQGNDDV